MISRGFSNREAAEHARQVKSGIVLARAARLQSRRLMNQAQEPRSRGGSFVAVALHATAGLANI